MVRHLLPLSLSRLNQLIRKPQFNTPSILTSPTTEAELRSMTPPSKEPVLRSCLVWLAAIIAAVGLATHSWKKMAVTYAVGVVGIAGVLLPDWNFFNRDFSRWSSPITSDEIDSSSPHHRSRLYGFGAYPVRVILYTAVYGFALYKWWMYVSS